MREHIKDLNHNTLVSEIKKGNDFLEEKNLISDNIKSMTKL